MISPLPVSGYICTIIQTLTWIQGNTLRAITGERVKSKLEMQISAIVPVRDEL
jgi:hypothetical protein